MPPEPTPRTLPEGETGSTNKGQGNGKMPGLDEKGNTGKDGKSFYQIKSKSK